MIDCKNEIRDRFEDIDFDSIEDLLNQDIEEILSDLNDLDDEREPLYLIY